MKLTLTDRTDTRRLRILLHGQSGAGKTWLARTVPDPRRCLLVATEPGTLSLADVAMPMAICDSPGDVAEVLTALARPPQADGKGLAAKIDWVWLDSLHALAEAILAEELARSKDGRAAYGQMQTRVVEAIGAICRLPQHVVCTCRQERVLLDGRQMLVPGMPGQSLTHKAPIAHAFDAVWALQIIPGRDGGTPYRMLACDAGADPMITAKTRDPWGVIAPWELPRIAPLAARLLAPPPPPPPAVTQAAEAAEPADAGEE